MIATFEEVTSGEQGRVRGNKNDDREFGQQTQLQYDVLDLFDYGDAPPPPPLLPSCAKPLHLCSKRLKMMALMATMQLSDLCEKVKGDSWVGERCSLLLLVMLLLLLLLLLLVVVVVVVGVVVVDVVVVVIQ